MNSKKDYIESKITFIEECNKNRLPLAEVARNLRVKYDTLRKYLKVFNINYQCNPHRTGFSHKESWKPLKDILESNTSNSKKRMALIREGIKEAKCECCSLSEWRGRPIPLELHHKDCNHYNNSLDNLQILCANCHMQAHNYCNCKVK